MGSESDAPQPGFHHWVSFKGQGTYWPNPNGLNVNGRQVAQKGYLTDELTDYALDWLNARTGEKPFLLYLAHKAVHTDFLPEEKAKQHGKLLVPGVEGDIGYAWGEHGMVDKRSAYEESMRIPMIVHCPDLIEAGTQVPQMLANIDIAPTILEAAGLAPPGSLDGRSFLPLLEGRSIPWRDKLLYEYYWEWNFPMTPTIHAIRTDRHKYIRPYGLWDVEELYDLENDPREIVNLIREEQHQTVAKDLKQQMFQMLKDTAGMTI